MKSPSLDAMYAGLDRHILLAQSYTEIKELSFIIKTCRLKPYSYIFEDRTNNLILYKLWFDEYGNSLQITDSKKIKIIHNDLSLDLNNIICTDLYYGLSLDKVIKISKLAYLFIGKDEDLYQECCLVSFLGIDNFLRTYMYSYGEWKQASPLLLGLKNLRTINGNLDIKYFQKFENKENMLIPCSSAETWLTCIPMSQEFTELLEKQYDKVVSIFK